jgi:succinate dehydrogenase/fumarate reductase flavoprotein subunit
MITDKINAGTSRNAGSDKQTYYKLTLAGDGADSVADMAETLFAGGAMDGDIALVEAAWSARAFFHLVDAGVPFPHDDYGQYVGYKTDHDPRQRATSVGPYTSKSMVEHLAARVEAAGVPVMEGYRVVDLLTMPCHAAGQSQDADRHFARSRRIQEDGEGNTPRHIVGLLTWKIDEAKYVLFSCDAVVYATGGPAGMYADSVYPHGQWGAQGAALRAGAKAKNLTEWQFGLASLRPRWNVSGSYMQVIPRFISTDATGGDEREFLADSIKDTGVLSSLVFLKGYQWPFDSRKAQSGSSLIDLLVYRETVQRGRRVYLDFRTNPMGYGPELLSEEARVYLDRAGVLHKDTPIARLRGMNEPAYQFYLERNPGLDLEKDLLEIAVCAQHNNGGLAADSWWQSNIEGFFPVGEAAGAHGVYRPGGAALNSGQVGATRAATWIAEHLTASSSASFDFADLLEAAVPLILGADSLMERATDAPADEVDADDLLAEAMRRMSDQAGLVRTPAGISTALAWVKEQLASLDETPPRVDPTSRQSLDRLFLLKDVLTSQYVYLSAMADYLNHGGKSRGSVLYTDADGYLPTLPDGTGLDLPEDFRFSNDNGALDDVIQETAWTGPEPTFDWRPRRPIPTPEDSFEKVWKTYRESR